MITNAIPVLEVVDIARTIENQHSLDASTSSPSSCDSGLQAVMAEASVVREAMVVQAEPAAWEAKGVTAAVAAEEATSHRFRCKAQTVPTSCAPTNRHRRLRWSARRRRPRCSRRIR